MLDRSTIATYFSLYDPDRHVRIASYDSYGEAKLALVSGYEIKVHIMDVQTGLDVLVREFVRDIRYFAVANINGVHQYCSNSDSRGFSLVGGAVLFGAGWPVSDFRTSPSSFGYGDSFDDAFDNARIAACNHIAHLMKKGG